MTSVKAPFTRAGWVFEIKYDGFRTLALHQGDDVVLVSRRGNDMTGCYPEVAASLRTLPHIIIDGELVILDSTGRPQFDRLRRRLALKRPGAVDLAARQEPATLMAFDLLMLEGKDLRALPLLKRKAALKKVLGRQRAPTLRRAYRRGRHADVRAGREARPGRHRGEMSRSRVPEGPLRELGEDQDHGRSRDR